MFDTLCEMAWLIISCLSFTFHVHLSHYLSIAFSPCIAPARWVDKGMHYSSVCPFCHCKVELWAEGCKAELQSINKALTLTTMGYIEMVWWSFHTSNSLSSLVFCSFPVKSPKHLLQKKKQTLTASPQWWQECGQNTASMRGTLRIYRQLCLSSWFWHNTRLNVMLLVFVFLSKTFQTLSHVDWHLFMSWYMSDS